MPPRPVTPPKGRHLTEEQLAELLGVSAETVRSWRKKGTGPDPWKAEGKAGTIRYPESWVNEWLETRRVRMTA